MNRFSISVDRLFDGLTILNNATLTVEHSVIQSIEVADSPNVNQLAGLLVAGFIDVQVNGGGGCLFNDAPSVESLEIIGKAHQQFGTTGWLPTLITDSFEKMQHAADAVALACKQAVPGVLGIHFEGPHLSTEKKGVHQTSMIREITDKEISLFCRQDLGRVLVTLAPEYVSPKIIAELRKNNVIVSLGHSNATYEQTRAALQAGASGFTHLFNAMSPLQSREPGMVGAALMDPDAWCGLILDGVHVHPVTAKLALNLKQNILLVTDAMPLVGSQHSSFELYGEMIHQHGDRLFDSEGRLAGSNLTMLQAVRNCQNMLACSLPKALNMASENPARFLGIEKDYGRLAVGKKASMLLLDKDQQVAANWIDGRRVI